MKYMENSKKNYKSIEKWAKKSYNILCMKVYIKNKNMLKN